MNSAVFQRVKITTATLCVYEEALKKKDVSISLIMKPKVGGWIHTQTNKKI